MVTATCPGLDALTDTPVGDADTTDTGLGTARTLSPVDTSVYQPSGTAMFAVFTMSEPTCQRTDSRVGAAVRDREVGSAYYNPDLFRCPCPIYVGIVDSWAAAPSTTARTKVAAADVGVRATA